MNLWILSNSLISSSILVAIFEVPALPGIQKISLIVEDLDIEHTIESEIYDGLK